jgi:uncharacterized protein (DUF302 family)
MNPLSTTLSTSFEDALARTKQALMAEGFGVLTEIDVQSTLRQKLGADIARYQILGACAPSFAHRAISHDLRAGLMMPCNVAVYAEGEAVTVAAVDPGAAPAVQGNAALGALASEVREKLARVIASLSSIPEPA